MPEQSRRALVSSERRGNSFPRSLAVPNKKDQRLPRKKAGTRKVALVMESGDAANALKVVIEAVTRATNRRKVIPPQNSRWKYFESVAAHPCGEK